jgi:L-histidine Nalpha-methyltransferase
MSTRTRPVNSPDGDYDAFDVTTNAKQHTELGRDGTTESVAQEFASAANAVNAPAFPDAPCPEQRVEAPSRQRTRSSVPPMSMEEIGDLARHVRVGLLRRPRVLPSRWMFDDVGTSLYEAWSALPECGIARAEGRLLERNAQRLTDAIPTVAAIVELGPSSARRKRKLLETIARRGPLAYTSIEVSEATLRRHLRDLGDMPGIHITGHEGGLANIGQALAISRSSDPGRTGALVMWLGAGIGALDLIGAEQALITIRNQLLPGDALLLGTDLMKHESVLMKAYDDAAGIAAALSRAFLARINRELGGELDVRQFRHEARWNEAQRRVEIHLVAASPIHAKVNASGIVVHMDVGESIWTASAHKLLPHEPAQLGARTGFAAACQWLDPTWPYAATLLVAQ